MASPPETKRAGWSWAGKDSGVPGVVVKFLEGGCWGLVVCCSI